MTGKCRLQLLYGRGGSEQDDPTALARLDMGESKPTPEPGSRLLGLA